MATFVLKYQIDGKANRNRPDQTVQRDRLVLGTSPSADLFVKDRLVGSEAAILSFDGMRLTVEIRNDFGGAFLEGRPISGRAPFPDGASLQMGYLLVKAAIDAAKTTCTLTVSEAHLPATVAWFVRQEKVEPEFSLEGSGPQEHLWGKSPVLRRLNGIAVVLGAAALLGFPLLKDTEAVTRGALAHGHAAGSSEKAPKSCADCHSPFSSDYGPKCAKCHEGYEKEAFHPYSASKEFSCSVCHQDHLGADSTLLPAMEEAKPGAWPSMCAKCHGPMEGRKPKGVRDREAPPSSRALLVDGFSHEDHRVVEGRGLASSAPAAPQKSKVPVACADCHKRLEAKEGKAEDFGAVPYERCLDCHATWSVPVHGRDQAGAACLKCHAPAVDPSKITKDLRKVELAATGSKFVLPPRKHDFRADECLKCHVVGREPKDGKSPIVEKVFRHDHHMETVAAAPGTGAFLSRSCQECHRTLAGSDSMAGVPVVDMDGCVKCHADGAPTAVADPAAPKRTVADMFHKSHAPGEKRDSLAAGCLSCHVPAAGADRMEFKPGAADCSSCHTRHENLAEGKCVLCHLDRANEGNRGPEGKVRYRFLERGIFEATAATMKPRGTVEKFDHFSRGHAAGKCADCHEEKAVDGARRVLAVPLPKPDAASCVECHNRTRYHR
jgi:hypothetical protein